MGDFKFPAFAVFLATTIEAKSIINNNSYQWNNLSENHYFSKIYNFHLVISGIGKVNAAYALSKIINTADEIIILGTSGGLGNEQIGDIYFSSEFVEHDMDVSGLGVPKGVTPFSWMKNFLIEGNPSGNLTKMKTICENLGLTTNTARIMSGDQFINDPKIIEEKKNLFGANLVDMESAAVAKICALEKKHVFAARYISDNANHDAANNWNENVRRASVLFDKILKGFVQQTEA